MRSLTPRQIERMQRVHRARLEATPETWGKKAPLSPYVQLYRKGQLTLDEAIAAEKIRSAYRRLTELTAVRTMAAVSMPDGPAYKSWVIQGARFEPEVEFDLRRHYRKWYTDCRENRIDPRLVIEFACEDVTVDAIAKERAMRKDIVRQVIKRGLGLWSGRGSGLKSGRGGRMRVWRNFGAVSSGRQSQMPPAEH